MDRVVRIHSGGTVTEGTNGVELTNMSIQMLIFDSAPSFAQLEHELGVKFPTSQCTQELVFKGKYDVGTGSVGRIQLLLPVSSEASWKLYKELVCGSPVHCLEVVVEVTEGQHSDRVVRKAIGVPAHEVVAEGQHSDRVVRKGISAPVHEVCDRSSPIPNNIIEERDYSRTPEPLESVQPPVMPTASRCTERPMFHGLKDVGTIKTSQTVATSSPPCTERPMFSGSKDVGTGNTTQMVAASSPSDTAQVTNKRDAIAFVDALLQEMDYHADCTSESGGDQEAAVVDDTPSVRNMLRRSRFRESEGVSATCIATVDGEERTPICPNFSTNFSSDKVEPGTVFETLDIVKMWLASYAVQHHRPYKVKKAEKARWWVKCVHEKEGCDWSVLCKKAKATGKWKISSVKQPHNEHCSMSTPGEDHPNLSSELVAILIATTVREQPSISPKEIIEVIRTKTLYVIHYGMAWKAKQIAMRLVDQRNLDPGASLSRPPSDPDVDHDQGTDEDELNLSQKSQAPQPTPPRKILPRRRVARSLNSSLIVPELQQDQGNPPNIDTPEEPPRRRQRREQYRSNRNQS